MFAQFASDLDRVTQQQLERGNRIVEILKQPQYKPMPVAKQIAIIYAATNGFLDEIPVLDCKRFESELHTFLDAKYPDYEQEISSTGKLSDELEQALKKALAEFKASFRPSAGPETSAT